VRWALKMTWFECRQKEVLPGFRGLLKTVSSRLARSWLFNIPEKTLGLHKGWCLSLAAGIPVFGEDNDFAAKTSLNDSITSVIFAFPVDTLDAMAKTDPLKKLLHKHSLNLVYEVARVHSL
jgi:hypothetical protein